MSSSSGEPIADWGVDQDGPRRDVRQQVDVVVRDLGLVAGEEPEPRDQRVRAVDHFVAARGEVAAVVPERSPPRKRGDAGDARQRGRRVQTDD